MSRVQGIMRIRENADSDRQFEIKLTVDFAGATEQQLAEWAFANRKIAFQNMLRENWNEEAMERAEREGMTVLAIDASKKVESPEQMKARIKADLASGKLSREQLLALLDE